MKVRSPLLGYNNNVRHQGKLYHIQTEDSGTQHAHIFTHLFAEQEVMGPYSRPSVSQSYVLECADGKWIALHMSSPPKFWEGLAKASYFPPHDTVVRDLIENGKGEFLAQKLPDRPSPAAPYLVYADTRCKIVDLALWRDWLQKETPAAVTVKSNISEKG